MILSQHYELYIPFAQAENKRMAKFSTVNYCINTTIPNSELSELTSAFILAAESLDSFLICARSLFRCLFSLSMLSERWLSFPSKTLAFSSAEAAEVSAFVRRFISFWSFTWKSKSNMKTRTWTCTFSNPTTAGWARTISEYKRSVWV